MSLIIRLIDLYRFFTIRDVDLGKGMICPFPGGSAYPTFCGELGELRLATAFRISSRMKSTTLSISKHGGLLQLIY
jgi:hypothetical protein